MNKLPLFALVAAIFVGSAVFAVSPATASAAYVDLKINGSDSPAPVVLGMPVSITWPSSGVGYCNTGSSPAYPMSWGAYGNATVGQGATFIPTVAGTLRFGIQCAENQNTGMIVQDWVSLNAVAPTIAITAPNGGETLTPGQTYNITWTSKALPNITEKVYLLDYSGAAPTSTLIGSVLASKNAYVWQVPSTLSGTKFKLLVSYDARSYSGGYVEDSSDNYFNIVAPAITVTSSPTSVVSGSNFQISWTSRGSIPTVGIYFCPQGEGINGTHCLEGQNFANTGIATIPLTGYYSFTNTYSANWYPVVRDNSIPSPSQAYGAGAVFSIVPPVAAPPMAVSVNSSYPNQAASQNTAGVKIGSYVIQNQSTSESAKINSLIVGISGTSPLSNLSALRTSETSGAGATPVQPQASNTFAVNKTLAPGASTTLDIFADSSITTGVNVVTTLSVSYVGLTTNISGTIPTTTGQTITFTNVTLGNPTFVASSSTVAQYIAASNGVTDATKATYNFTSTGSATITELKFNVTGANTVTAVRVGSVSAVPVSGVAYLTGLNLAIPNGGAGLNVDAFVSYASVGTAGIASGTASSIALTSVKYTTGGTTQTITPSVSASTMVLVGSRPSMALSAPNTVLVAGINPVANITVTADAKGDIKINQIPLAFTGGGATTITLAGVAMNVKDSNGVSIPVTVNITGNGTASATAVVIFTNGYTIAAGTSQTFKIEVTANAGVGSITTGVGPAYSFFWTDVAGNSTLGFAGGLIYNFPVNTVTIHN